MSLNLISKSFLVIQRKINYIKSTQFKLQLHCLFMKIYTNIYFLQIISAPRKLFFINHIN